MPRSQGSSSGVFGATDGRHVGQVLVMKLSGAAFFDEAVLAGWEGGIVEALAGARPSRSTWVADQAGEQRATAARWSASAGSDVFAVVTASTAEDAALVAGRMR